MAMFRRYLKKCVKNRTLVEKKDQVNGIHLYSRPGTNLITPVNHSRSPCQVIPPLFVPADQRKGKFQQNVFKRIGRIDSARCRCFSFLQALESSSFGVGAQNECGVIALDDVSG